MRTFLVILCLLLCSQLTAVAEPKVKRLQDGSGPYIQEMVKRKTDTLNQIKKKVNSQPFVVAFFGWRSFQLAQLGTDRYSAALHKINSLAVQFYDPNPQLQATLQSLQSKGTSDQLVPSSKAELDALRNFVVGDYHKRYVMDLENLSKQFDPELKWRYQLGANLGELSGKISAWHLVSDRAIMDRPVAETLTGLGALYKTAPAGTDANLLSKIRILMVFDSKNRYSLNDRDLIADALRDVLMATVVFSEGPAFKP